MHVFCVEQLWSQWVICISSFQLAACLVALHLPSEYSIAFPFPDKHLDAVALSCRSKVLRTILSPFPTFFLSFSFISRAFRGKISRAGWLNYWRQAQATSVCTSFFFLPVWWSKGPSQKGSPSTSTKQRIQSKSSPIFLYLFFVPLHRFNQ